MNVPKHTPRGGTNAQQLLLASIYIIQTFLGNRYRDLEHGNVLEPFDAQDIIKLRKQSIPKKRICPLVMLTWGFRIS